VLAVILWAVAPVLQLYEVKPPAAASDTLPPVQNVVGPPGVIELLGKFFAVTDVTDDDAEQLFPSVTVTE
jgi:hypothetical protein